jgi:hypothetical protein
MSFPQPDPLALPLRNAHPDIRGTQRATIFTTGRLPDSPTFPALLLTGAICSSAGVTDSMLVAFARVLGRDVTFSAAPWNSTTGS